MKKKRDCISGKLPAQSKIGENNVKTRILACRRTALLLAAALLLSMAACGLQNITAAAMHLTRAEGSVAVSDGGGKDVPVLDNLGLYSGYGVNTRSASYAWINLDDVKLAKMDEKSQIAIQKDGKNLEIEVRSGRLFFNVTEPLADDETMTIRSSTMIVGIRGTCGWVEVTDARHMNVYLLEGKVKCTAGESVTVMAGEVGRLDRRAETVTVESFTQDDIPDFVRGELDGIPLDAIPGTAEPTPGPAPEPTPEPTPNPTPEPDPITDAMAQYRVIVGQAASYDYGAVDPTGTYRYALVQMRAGHKVPALLLEQDTDFGISNVLVFQYEPDSRRAFLADGTMSEGAASAGGYRGSLFAAGDGNGVLSTEFSSGTGMGSTSRITLDGSSLRSAVLWEGNIFDTNPIGEEVGFLEIDWHDVADISGLSRWAPDADDVRDYHFTDRNGTEMTAPGEGFAARVVEFIPGDPWTSYEPAMDPENALGAPDYTGDRYTAQGGLTMGAGGVLVLEFSAAIYDGEGLDIYVFEVGSDVEDTKVEVSNDLITWYDVGIAKGKTAGVDLSGKVPEGSQFRYVRLTDLRSSPIGAWPGADIDAVCGLNVRALSGG